MNSQIYNNYLFVLYFQSFLNEVKCRFMQRPPRYEVIYKRDLYKNVTPIDLFVLCGLHFTLIGRGEIVGQGHDKIYCSKQYMVMGIYLFL